MLLGNRSAFHKLPLRFLGGSTTATHVTSRSGFGQAGMRRNRFYQDGATVALKTYSYPQGTYAPSGSQNVGSAYILPQQSGSMASFNAAGLAIVPTALAVGGITTTGSADFSIVTNTPAGQLIAFGIGSASLLISTNTPLLTASLNAIGSASFVLTTNTPLLGAVARGTGSASLLISVSATMLPTNDASPLRTATANFAITGSLTPYAIGSMSGSTVDTSSIVNANIVSVNGYSVTGNGQTGSEWGPT